MVALDVVRDRFSLGLCLLPIPFKRSASSRFATLIGASSEIRPDHGPICARIPQPRYSGAHGCDAAATRGRSSSPARSAGRPRFGIAVRTPAFAREPFEQKLDAVSLDAVALHDEADKRIGNQLGQAPPARTGVVVAFPVHRPCPIKADRFRMVNSWAGGPDRAIPQLARARRCTGQPASCCMFPSCPAEFGSAGRAVMRLAAWAGCRL